MSLATARMILGPEHTVADYLTWLERELARASRLDPATPVEYPDDIARATAEVHVVYRVRHGQQTVYVGVTSDLRKRWRQHLKSSRWAEESMTIEGLITFDSRTEALACERQLIETEQPIHNTRYTIRDPRTEEL